MMHWIEKIAVHRRLLLLSVLCVLLPHILRIPFWLTLFCLMLLAWRVLFELKLVPGFSRWPRFIFTVAGTLSVAYSFHTIVGREAGSALLLLMLCLKLTELRSQRDIVQCMLLGYFVVVVSFLFSQSIWMGAYLVVVIVLITASLNAFAHSADSDKGLPFTRYLQLSGKLLLQALPLAALLFVLFPRLPGPLWSLPEDGYNARTGLSDSMSPGNISRLTDSNAVAFRAKFDQLPERVNDLYWRGPVFWYYDGRVWSNPTGKVKKHYELGYKAIGKRVNYTVTLEPHDKQWLFAVDMPAQIPFGSYLTPEYQLMSDEPVNQLFRYSVSSYPSYRLEAHNPPKARYVSLPTRSAPKAQLLVRQWQQQIHRPEKMVAKALDFFRTQPFYYSRNPPLLPDNPVDEFLFKTRRGYCEHFAASFTVLMRLAGIPARVVTGYYGGEVNPISDYVIVRQSRAHAWSEVWLEGKGWTRVDPTSVIPESRVESVEDLSRIQPLSRRVLLTTRLDWLGESMQQLNFLWDAVNNRWNQWVVGFNDEKQRDIMAWLGLEKVGSYALVVLLAVGSSLFLLFASLILMRPRQQKQSPVQRLYSRFCRKMAKRGLTRSANEGALDFAKRVAQQFPAIKSAVFAIAEDYYRVRYADQPTAECVARMKHNLKQL